MPIYLIIAQIVIALALIAVLTLQVKGGGLGGIFGQADGVYRTRRGVEKTLFQVTIVLAVIFIALSIVIVRVSAA
ncbi:MAG: preprotein translocase subunit SecG [Dehalococcoidia bacterium]|jgi:preprotein translocase subunit SecG